MSDRLRIGITGVSGFIGSALAKLASEQGHAVVGFSRSPERPRPGCSAMRPFHPPEPVDASDLDALIHLAGESILGVWTPAKKKAILESRIRGTRAVVGGLDRAGDPQTRLVSASAVGYYGSRGEEPLDEDSPPGTGFLASTAVAWENEAARARGTGHRVAIVRIGLVLGNGGDALDALVRVFKLGLGGRLGDGKQWMPLVHVRDVAGILLHAATSPINAPLNACLPEPVRNREFTERLAAHLRRPAFFHVPSPILRLLPGGSGELFLSSALVSPKRTMESGYDFRFPNLDAMLDNLLARGPTN